MGGADAVTVGNRYIHDFAAKHNAEVHLITTSGDLDWRPSRQNHGEPPTPFIIGWIGSSGTTPHLKAAEPALPAIASPVGESSIIMDDGATGFHARTEDDGLKALWTLYGDPALRRRMGQAGRAKGRDALFAAAIRGALGESDY